MDIDALLRELTVEEKAALVAGTDFMYTNPVPRLGIPSLRMSDGPHGLRVQQKAGDNGTSNSEIATSFPTAATTASSFNPENVYRMARAMGKEARHYGVSLVLGPAVNIKRNPLGGRCFEYFSEDPYLAGRMGIAQVKGLAEEGVGAAVKHFALNNSENYRFMGDSIADERAMREIYLRPFEMIVKESAPETLMCAYNKVNGEFCCQNGQLLNDILRREWGFLGLVMTDWGATHDRLAMLRAGLDLEMPGDTAICRKWIVEGIASGALAPEVLDTAVRRVLELVSRHERDGRVAADFATHHALACEIAMDSAVLMKNDGFLPLASGERVLVVGELFEKMRYQGSGSSMINPAFLSTPRDAWEAHGEPFTYVKGYRANRIAPDGELIREALESAKEYERVLVFAGLTDLVESEAVDREHMRLPDGQLALIDALLEAGKRVAVVLFGGSPVELPFADGTEAILNMYLPGQNGGEATYALVYGERSPSGRLAESWPISYGDVPFGESFSKGAREVYKESVFVGYRYYTTAGVEVRYPFGHGLSYTSFAYGDMRVERCDGGYRVGVTVTNVGEREGGEVVSLYLGKPGVRVFAPRRELCAFQKVYLAPKESAHVELTVEDAQLCYRDVLAHRDVVEGGEYRFEICADAETVIASQTVMIEGECLPSPYSDQVLEIYRTVRPHLVSDAIFEDMSGRTLPEELPKTPIRMESRFSDLKHTFMGRIIYNTVILISRFDLLKAKFMKEGVAKDNCIKGAIFMERILASNTPVTMSMAAGGLCPYHVAVALVHLSNGAFLRALGSLLSKTKAPRLPKEEKRRAKKTV